MSDAAKPATTDPTHDLLRYEPHALDVFFRPQSVAVIGATETEGAVGRTLIQNLIASPFGGAVFPVNPRRPQVLGIKAYSKVGETPGPVDLAVIATPAPAVPGIIKECAEKGVRGAIIISAGFKETGSEGAELERQVLNEARAGGLRVIGPNCLGVMSPVTGLNATFAQTIARPGSVALVSQSGALCTAILDWSLREMVGFSAFVSIGSMLDVGWGDLIDYLGNDPHTKSIVLYVESIGDARAFLSAAREVALTKPIIVIKAGRTALGAKAAASHTGSLTGSDEVLETAFRRCGVLRVDNISDLFYMAGILASQPRPRGPRLAILTNAGGPGVLATDGLIRGGGELAALSEETLKTLNELLPAHWSHSNPIDILGDAGEDRYAKALEAVANDSGSDGLLVILTPQAMTQPTRTAEAMRPHAHTDGKPILASWMGGPAVAAGQAVLSSVGIPNFPFPDTAARMFNYLWQYSDNLHGLYETPSLLEESTGAASRDEVSHAIEAARQAGRTLLTELEAKQILRAYGIPTVPTSIAASEDDAIDIAKKTGFPVVLKLHSETITHKTDVGGVQLNLKDADAVRSAFRAIQKSVAEKAGAEHFQGVTVQPMVRLEGYELILGSSIDPQFGPVILFGMGGQLVEVLQDRALALPPLNTTLARRTIEQTRIYKALQGVRGRKPVDLPALESLLVRFSHLVVEQPAIQEIDINPLLASGDGLLALDARIVLQPAGVTDRDLPQLAIRPYPAQYIQQSTLRDGTPVTLRPIRPEDEPLVVSFHQALSDRSVYLRYFQPLRLSQRIAHDRLIRICFNDYDREIALVVLRQSGEKPEILAIGRLSKLPHTDRAEFAMLVRDQQQRQGLGTMLLRQLVQIGKQEGVREIRASILADNIGMQRICETLGFELRRQPGDTLVSARLSLA